MTGLCHRVRLTPLFPDGPEIKVAHHETCIFEVFHCEE